jgi:endonuclease/exonuclease/phosphatase family metal-dependent hydrolase
MRRNVIAVAITSPWWLFALMRILALDRFWPLIPAVAFTPQVTVVVFVPLLIALLLRAKWTLLAIAVLGAILVGLLVPRAIGGDGPDVDGRKVTILSANLLHGDASPRALREAIAKSNPDIIALQEATPYNLEQLRAAGVLKSHPYLVGDPEPGTLGFFTLSRWKMTPVTQHRWPTYRVAGQGFLFRNIHPAPPVRPRSATANWKRTLAGIASAGTGAPRVTVGDMNATLDHRDLRAVIDRGYTDAGADTGNGFEWTWRGVGRPMQLVIDHILLDERARASNYEVFDLPGSDHNAIAATVQFAR